MHLLEARQPSGVRSRLDIRATSGLTPFVGRQHELMLLGDRFEKICEGSGQAVFVCGEAGIGKSRLVMAFHEQLNRHSHTWLECRGSPYGRDSAFHPVLELQRRGLEFQASDATATKVHCIEKALSGVGFDLCETVPLLCALHGVPPDSRYAAPTLTPEGLRNKTLRFLTEWLLRLGQHQPLVLLMEDIHWMDPSTVELLGHVIEQIPTARVLLIATYRPDFVAPWTLRGHTTPVLLARFNQHELAEIVRKTARGLPLPETWVDAILRRADGVPLFAEELTRTVLETSANRNGGDPAAEPWIPDTLQDSLTARLDMLGSAKKVVQLASVLGREFEYQLLAWSSSAGHDELRIALQAGIDADILYQRGEPPDAHFIFRHALIRDAAYQSTLRSTRRHHHRLVAEALVENMPGIAASQPELVAHHYAEAGELSPAIAHFARAAEQAFKKSAYAESVAHASRAIDLLESGPTSTQRDQHELELQTILGLGLMATEGYGSAGAERSFSRAEDLCDALDESEPFPIAFGHWLYHFVRSDVDAELASAHKLQFLAQRSGEMDHEIEAQLATGLTRYYRAEFASAREHLERVLELYEPNRHATHAYTYGQDPAAYATCTLALLLWQVGFPDKARRQVEEATALARVVGHPFTLAGVISSFGPMTLSCCGDLGAALEYVREGHAVSAEQAFPMWASSSHFYEGYARLGGDNDDQATTQLLSGLAGFRATGALRARSQQLCYVAEAQLRIGKISEGLAAIEEAYVFSTEHCENYWVPEIHRLRGELLLASNQDAHVAEASFVQAVDTARAIGSPSFELRAVTSLARYWQRQGKRAEARDRLSQAYAWFNEGFDTRDLMDSAALLERLK